MLNTITSPSKANNIPATKYLILLPYIHFVLKILSGANLENKIKHIPTLVSIIPTIEDVDMLFHFWQKII